MTQFNAEVHEDEMWIKDDPNGDPSSLRFAPGNLVLYKLENGWVEGEVLKVCQRLEIPPEFAAGGTNLVPAPPILYIVWPHSEVSDEEYGSHWIHEDTDDFIRPRLEDKTPDPTKFNPMLVPPRDNLEHLYTDVTYDPYDEDGNDMAEAFQRCDGVNSAERKPDGTILLDIEGKDRPVSAYVAEIPQEPIFGVPGPVVMQVGGLLQKRQAVSGLQVSDPIKMFKRCVPSEASLSELEAASRTSHEKMLQLGDALMSGVHGWPRDPRRACQCYEAAAWGCQENEESGRTGMPVGSPEAMVAVVTTTMTYIKKEILGLDLWDNVRTDRVFNEALRSQRGKSLLYWGLFWLRSAIQRGHIAPWTLDIASTVVNMDLLNDQRIQNDPDIKEMILVLLAVHEYRQLESAFEEMQRTGAVPRGDPTDNVISMFSKKVDSIFNEIPMEQTFQVHIEYRQVPRAPFPVVVYTIDPHGKRAIKVVRLPDYLQAASYTEESFVYVWERIAFELHLGDATTKERKRPRTFTVLDTHGNRQFAAFLRLALDGTGTRVRLVSHQEPIRLRDGRRRHREVQLGDIVRQVENNLLRIPNYLVDERMATSDVEGQIQRYVKEISEEYENNPDRLQSKAQEYKDQGNGLFASNDYLGASRCYSISVELLRLLPNPSDDARRLLGTTLSNRAACYLELESQMTSVAFQKLLVQNAIRDCMVALQSSWAERLLPGRIIEKLKFRQDKATARLDVLETDFQSEIASIIFPQSSARRQSEQQQDTTTAPLQRGSENEPIAGDNPPAASLETAVEAVTRLETDHSIDLLVERGQIIYDNGLAKNSRDGCPVCLREFDGELSHTLASVLPCGEHALCIECICNSKKQADKQREGVACPLCRFQFDGDIVQGLAYHIIEKDESLSNLVKKFPADFDESNQVAYRLLWTMEFNVDRVVESMENILDDRVSGLFFRTEMDLTHKQKQEIYLRARLPVVRLEQQIQRLVEERRTTFQTERLKSIELELRRLRSDLATERLKARDEIYEKLNSVGSMGAQNSEVGDIVQVDFHGLHVGEMHSKYKELVEVILPVVKKVRAITGRGLHSTSGESKLLKALKKKIEKDEETRWDKVPNNPGAIDISWVG